MSDILLLWGVLWSNLFTALRTLASLITGRIKIPTEYFPAFAFPRGKIHLNNLQEGLFRGEAHIRVSIVKSKVLLLTHCLRYSNTYILDLRLLRKSMSRQPTGLILIHVADASPLHLTWLRIPLFRCIP